MPCPPANMFSLDPGIFFKHAVVKIRELNMLDVKTCHTKRPGINVGAVQNMLKVATAF